MSGCAERYVHGDINDEVANQKPVNRRQLESMVERRRGISRRKFPGVKRAVDDQRGYQGQKPKQISMVTNTI